MKQQKTFIVLRDKKTGYFLSAYKNRTGRLAYEASWVELCKRCFDYSRRSLD